MPRDFKFAREKHKRDDNAKKSNYRDELVFETTVRSSPEHFERFRAVLKAKQQQIDVFKAATYSWDRYHFCLSWKLQQFARNNRLWEKDLKTRLIFQSVSAKANKDFHAIRQAIQNASVTCNHLGKSVEVQMNYLIRYRTCRLNIPEISHCLKQA